jgi:NADH:ubiquinone oxidoreductase subunit 5 (subunit L)/multisubunit Na+/H+ antiporter MnhA subunit
MTTGVIALAVPGSAAFAGEFAILAGVFQTGWGYAVVGAVAIVLAAMYMLRLISAVLHRSPGVAVPDAALDLRPAELGIVVPLIAILLVLSAWPAAITDRSFVGGRAASIQRLTEAFDALMRKTPTSASFVIDPNTGCVSEVEHEPGTGNGGILGCSQAEIRPANPALTVWLP